MPLPTASRKAPVRVAVIGAGVIGLATALELRGRGADVVVYDRGTEIGAGVTIRAAGMLGAAFEWAAEDDHRSLAALARRAGLLWPDFAAKVERLGGGPIEYSPEGAIVVARNDGEMEWLEGLAAACQARGLPVDRLSTAALQAREGALTGRVRAALILPEDRQVDPALLLQRLSAALARQGVAFRFGRHVERIVGGQAFQFPDGDRFDRIVLATGVGSAPALLGPRGVPLPTGLPTPIPVKGQMLALAPFEGSPRHVIHARDVYIAPKSRWILVGATSERGRTDTEVEPDVLAGLHRKAAEIAPALADAPVLTSWAGIRPGSPDDAPLVGETAVPGVLAALGHYRNGVLLAPATAEIIADQIIDGKVSPLAAAFDPRRFDNGDEAPHSPSGSGLDK
jgi:glycine oxidase